MIIFLNQNSTFTAVQGFWWTIASDLLIPKPATFSRFFIRHSFHQARVPTTDTEERSKDKTHYEKEDYFDPDRLRRKMQKL
jgi:hypothetical protein